MKKIQLNTLFAAARHETAPAVDVADSVLAALAVYRQPITAVLSRSFVWMSMASSAIAAGIVLVAVITQWQTTDSVNELISIVSWVAQ